MKTCKEKCKHESIIRTYFGIECSLSRSTILISVSLNTASVQGSSEISFRCLANSSNVSVFVTGAKEMQGFLTKGHFVVVQEHDVCYWTSLRGFSQEDFQ